MGLFKTYSEKEVKRVQPLVKKINDLEPDMQKLSDKELRGKTDEFKKRLEKGEVILNGNGGVYGVEVKI